VATLNLADWILWMNGSALELMGFGNESPTALS
jgi:hypothetical protein